MSLTDKIRELWNAGAMKTMMGAAVAAVPGSALANGILDFTYDLQYEGPVDGMFAYRMLINNETPAPIDGDNYADGFTANISCATNIEYNGNLGWGWDTDSTSYSNFVASAVIPGAEIQQTVGLDTLDLVFNSPFDPNSLVPSTIDLTTLGAGPFTIYGQFPGIVQPNLDLNLNPNGSQTLSFDTQTNVSYNVMSGNDLTNQAGMTNVATIVGDGGSAAYTNNSPDNVKFFKVEAYKTP